MKKLIYLMAVLAFIGSISAQRGKKGAAKAAEKAPPAITTTAPVAANEPPAKSESGLVMMAGVFGAYGIIITDALPGVTQRGGISGGGNFLIGNKFIRGGVGATYMSLYKFSVAGSSITGAYLPIEGLVRIYPAGGFYLGVLGGYALNMSTVSGTGLTLSKFDGFTYGGSLGYLIEIGTSVNLDLGVDVRILSVSSSTATQTYTNIMPRFGVSLKF